MVVVVYLCYFYFFLTTPGFAFYFTLYVNKLVEYLTYFERGFGHLSPHGGDATFVLC